MGGTFDHLHIGHEYLIKTALSVSENIVIGLTGPEMLMRKKHADKIQDYETRETKLKEFISNFADIKRVQVVRLTDPYGPPIHDPEYDGIICSQETYQGALKINNMREGKGFKPMVIIVIPLLKNENNEKISSTAIREKL